MYQPQGRYVKRNVIDYILIAMAVLLLLTIPVRGLFYLQHERTDRTCRARAEFVVRSVDYDTVDALRSKEVFYTPEGVAIRDTRIVSVQVAQEYVPDEDGVMHPLPSPQKYNVRIAFTADGAQAQDGTFLLSGLYRLGVGEHMYLTHNGGGYEVDFVAVEIF